MGWLIQLIVRRGIIVESALPRYAHAAQLLQVMERERSVILCPNLKHKKVP